MENDALILNMKDTSWDECVTLDHIATDADAEKLRKKGFPLAVSWEKVSALLPEIQPEMIYLSKSTLVPLFYFNQETLAVFPLYFVFLNQEVAKQYAEQASRDIMDREDEVAAGDYINSIKALSDGLRMGYFQWLVEKRGTLDGELYSVFFDSYCESDYGFRAISTEMLETIIASKPDEKKARTRKQVEALPDLVTVYRGGNTRSTPYTQAWSWSPDINVAYFFAVRRGDGPGYVVKGTVHKEDIVEAFLEDTPEPEIIVRPKDVKDQVVTTLIGRDELNELAKTVDEDFQQYSFETVFVEFQMESELYNSEHSTRVLLLCLIMAELLHLPHEDIETLAWAAVYHDTGRTSDGVEPDHGKRAALYYRNSCDDSYDEVTNLIIYYHSLSDQEGYEAITREIQDPESQKRATMLYNIFKEADALYRFRFDDNRREIDVRMLRNPVAQKLLLAASIIYSLR